jgi:hypothetical protein
MPNVLVLSFEGFSFSSRQLYEQLLPKLLSRAIVHESLTIQDALNYVLSSWPTIILVTDPSITLDNEESQRLLEAISGYTKHGCTTIFMGFFAETVEFENLETMFKLHFDLPWRAAELSKHETRLLAIDESMIRTASLVPSFYANALFLAKVPVAQTVYSGPLGNTLSTYAAYGRVGLGKVGFVGDTNFGDEPERLILAMCHLDRPEDSLQEEEDTESWD